MKSQSVIAFGNVSDLLDTEQLHPGTYREFHQVDHALGSTKGKSIRWAQLLELEPVCATAGGQFSSRSLSGVWSKPWASSVISEAVTQLRVTEHLSLCSDTASITQRPLPGNLSNHSTSTWLMPDSKLSWNRYTRKDAWAVPGPLSPIVPLEEGSPHHKSSLWIYSGKCWPLLISVTAQVMLLLSNSKIQVQSRMEVIRAYL